MSFATFATTFSPTLTGAAAGFVGQVVDNAQRGKRGQALLQDTFKTTVISAAAGGATGLLLPRISPSLAIPNKAFGINSLKTFFTGTSGARVPVGLRFGIGAAVEQLFAEGLSWAANRYRSNVSDLLKDLAAPSLRRIQPSQSIVAK